MARLALVSLVAVLALAVSTATAGAVSGCRVAVRVNGSTLRGVVTRSVRTSCPFARSVVRSSLRLIVRAGGAGDGDFYVWASSPVTHRWYRAHCDAHGDLYGAEGVRVDCRAGVGARVVYRAWA